MLDGQEVKMSGWASRAWWGSRGTQRAVPPSAGASHPRCQPLRGGDQGRAGGEEEAGGGAEAEEGGVQGAAVHLQAVTGHRRGAAQDWSAVPGSGMLCVPVPTVPGAMPKPCAAQDSPKAGLPAGSWLGLGTAPALLAEPGRPQLPPLLAVVSVGVVRASPLPVSPACPPTLPSCSVPCPPPCQGLLPPSARGAVPRTPVPGLSRVVQAP